MKAKFYEITCDMQEKERPFRQECRALRFAFIHNIWGVSTTFYDHWMLGIWGDTQSNIQNTT